MPARVARLPVFKSVFAQRWCEAGGLAQADYQDAVLRVDGWPEILTGERLSEYYDCDDVS